MQSSTPQNTYQPSSAEFKSAGGGYTLPSYPFVKPPELIEQRMGYAPVVIVGAGLAGLTCAALLALRGVAAVVIDEDNTVGVRGASSRGICYAQRSLEIFEQIGIAQALIDKGVRWSIGRTFSGHDQVMMFDLSKLNTHNVSAQPAFVNVQQFYVEWHLVERIVQLGVVQLRWSSRVVDYQQDESGAVLTVHTPAGEYKIKADYVVDATGVHSPIRKQLDLNPSGQGGDDRWCICDVRFKNQPPAERWTWIKAPFNDDRAVWQHLMADDVWRLDYQMAPDADFAAVAHPEVVDERIKRHFGSDVEYELVWAGPYSYRSHCMDDFAHGRVFFMGDAAHVKSPFGARGGNSAIADADNLAWKLASVVQGRATASLLRSYSQERRPAALENIEVTRRTSGFLSPKSAHEFILREAVLSLAKQYPFAQPLVNTGRMSVANHYLNTACARDGVARPVQNVRLTLGAHSTTLAACIAQHPLDWIAVSGDLSCLQRLKTQCDSAGLQLQYWHVLHDGAVLNESSAGADKQVCSSQLLEQCGLAPQTTPSVALVRPDQYLAGVFDMTQHQADQRAVQSLAQWLGLQVSSKQLAA